MIHLEMNHHFISKKEIEDMANANQGSLQDILQMEERYLDNLGWLDVNEWANDAILDEIESIAKEIKKKADIFILIGVGGSNNAARSVIEGIGKKSGIEILYTGNTLSAKSYVDLMEKIKDKSIYINCIAKKFETLEPGMAFRILRSHLYEKYGSSAKERILATGTEGSALEELCKKEGYRFVEFPKNIGGRYTACSIVGLLPMAVAGADIRALVLGARHMQEHLFQSPYYENPAFLYACFRNVAYQKGYKIEVLSIFEPTFEYFIKWWIQLFAESEGKDGKGMYPMAHIFSEELHAVGQYIQEGEKMVMETFLVIQESGYHMPIPIDDKEDGFAYLNHMDIDHINKMAKEATIQAHEKTLPCLKISILDMSEKSFGELFYFFAFSCYISCYLMGVNPFNQPGVEAYKQYMFEKLGK